MLRIALKIEAADGSRTDIPEFLDSGNVDEEDNPVMIANSAYDLMWAEIEAGNRLGDIFVGPDSALGVPGHHVVLDAGALAKMINERAVSKAIQDEIDSRTVMVTIDDGVMQKTEEEIELQGPPTPADLATVKARHVAQQGVANSSHVTVETLTDFKAGQP